MADEDWQLLPGERLDDLQADGLKIIQRPGRFCFGTDSVLLAHFARRMRAKRVLDLCAGNGAVGLLLMAHCPGVEMTFLELQQENCDMLARTLAGNGLKAHIVKADARELPAYKALRNYELIVCNPPYWPDDGRAMPEDPAQRLARFESGMTLEACIALAAACLCPRGALDLVLPAQRAAEAIIAMGKAGLSPKRVRIVQARVGRDPSLVLLEGTRGGGKDAVWQAPLILYDAQGNYTPEMVKIYGSE
ncbi:MULTISPECIES: methyltransferase [unclassified Clostridium]|uniref:tRNA1(Val) (adenine(37)-N6)-methyltransferase n=1 Tax=unclassified Clostridium TaxID=2614128 RepID=UPI0011062F81|nr:MULTISPECIES: methyltransferase [unclassified Clostridium]